MTFSSFDEFLPLIRPKIIYRNTVMRASVPPKKDWQKLEGKNTELTHFFLTFRLLYQSYQHNIMLDTCLILVVALKYTFFFVAKIKKYNHKLSNLTRIVRNLLMVTSASIRGWHVCKASTAAGGSRLPWTRCEFGIRILRGLFALTLEVITNLVMWSRRNFSTGEYSSILSVCRWTRQVGIRRKLRWIADMVVALTKCYVPHTI